MFLVVKLTNRCLNERDHSVHPFARSRRIQLQYRHHLLGVNFHYLSLPLHSTSDRVAVDPARFCLLLSCKNVANTRRLFGKSSGLRAYLEERRYRHRRRG